MVIFALFFVLGVPLGSAQVPSPPFLCDTSYPFLDRDGDRMSDTWEIVHGLNTNLNDSAEDPDGDGRSNRMEYDADTDPMRPDGWLYGVSRSGLFAYGSLSRPTDSDGDGMPDAWESTHGLNPGANDAASDLDGDGRSNLAEWNAGTDPQVNDWAGPYRVATGTFLADTGGNPFPWGVDGDHDGMPDWWEYQYRLRLGYNDSADDADLDSLSNLAEYLLGTDPTVNDMAGWGIGLSALFRFNTAGRPLDTDGDGMPDYWELQYGLNPNVADAGIDTDGDGVLNVDEYNAGRDPTVDDLHGPSRLSSGDFVANTGAYAGRWTDDTDHDGMPDWWEFKYRLNLALYDPGADSDSDGVANLAEYLLGSNPRLTDYFNILRASSILFIVDTGGRYTDSDHDGIPDWWEYSYFGGKTVAEAGEDSDGDTVPNLSEFRAGTDPRDPFDAFSMEKPLQVNGAFRTLSWQSKTNKTYAIDWSVDLARGFTPITNGLMATPPLNVWTDTVHSADNGFYIVRVEENAP